MTNFEVYKKTLKFSIVSFLVGLLQLAIVIGAAVAGFFMMDKATDKALIGLVVGFLIGLVISILISVFVINKIKAAQIAMMAIGVVDNKLPDNVYQAGFAEVKGRFAKITGFFIVMGLIKGVFRQIGRGITKVGQAVGGNTGGSIGSMIDSGIQILIAYLADCCLGWVMYNKEKGVAEAACEGAVIFFKRGKTLIRNVGRIFGMGFLSLVVIGGAFFGISYLISNQLPYLFNELAREITEFAARENITDLPEFFKDPKMLMLVICAFIALALWGIIHSVLIRPFILVGVLNNFMKSGLEEKITNEDFEAVAKKSPKFAKLRAKEI